MKLRKVFAAFAALVLAASVNAQDTDYKTLVFVDDKGNVIENGATVTANKFVHDEAKGDMIVSGLSVRNTTSENVGVLVETEVTSIDNGGVECCFPQTCTQKLTAPGVYQGVEGDVLASETKDFATEWLFEGTGKCTATFRLKIMDVEYNDWGIPTYHFKADGPSVTVNFVNDPTGIEGVTGDKENKTIKGYYTIDGQSLAAPQKGVNVVKYSNGKSSKIIY